ncbi:CAAX amino terminal protease family protein [Enterococcus faecalis 13-SD-W-01]|nr:CAAX amino terminal protease family protein [Enterococcus faecalis 13-SD-W-01]
MFKKNYDLHYPYTYGEKSSFDLFAWFKLISITLFSFFFLTFFYSDMLELLLHGSFLEAVKKHWPEFSVLGGMLYLLINIGGLEWAAKDNWKLLFKKLTWKDAKIIVVFTILAWVAAIANALLFGSSVTSTANPALTHDVSTFFIHGFESIFQLMGEELIAIVPFLALVSLGKFLKLNNTWTTVIAVVLSSIIFGMAHTWTYGGVVQGIINTSLTRVVLTNAYVRTKNIWVSYIIHYIFDMSIFTLYLLFF